MTDAKPLLQLSEMKGLEYDPTKDGFLFSTGQIHAAMGLALLPHMSSVLANRRRKYVLYQRLLSERSFISFQKFQPESYNFSYMPVLFRDEALVIAMAVVLYSSRNVEAIKAGVRAALSGVSMVVNQLLWVAKSPYPAFGSWARIKFHFTSSLVKSRPVCHVTPLRRLSWTCV